MPGRQRVVGALIILGCTLAFLVAFLVLGALGIALAAIALVVVFAVQGWRAPVTRRLTIALGVAMLAYAVVLLLLLGGLTGFFGSNLSRNGWPGELSDMVAQSGASASEVKAADLGGFVDHEYAWRLPVSPGKLSSIVATFDLVEASPGSVPPGFRDTFPSGWRPSQSVVGTYLATPGFPVKERGPDGNYYFALYDTQSHQLYVWLKANF